MNLFIVKLIPKAVDMENEAFQKADSIHGDYYKTLMPDGTFIASGPELDENGQMIGGLFILRAENREQAQTIIEADPLVAAGFSTYEIRECQPLLINPHLVWK